MRDEGLSKRVRRLLWEVRGVRTEVEGGREGGRGWRGHPGPRAEQMSVTTCFLTPVRVLVTLRMQPAEKFMTLEVSCPPSKTAAPPPPPFSLLSLSFSSPFSTLALPTLPSTPHLPPDSSDSSHFDLLSPISHACVAEGQAGAGQQQEELPTQRNALKGRGAIKNLNMGTFT